MRTARAGKTAKFQRAHAAPSRAFAAWTPNARPTKYAAAQSTHACQSRAHATHSLTAKAGRHATLPHGSATRLKAAAPLTWNAAAGRHATRLPIPAFFAPAFATTILTAQTGSPAQANCTGAPPQTVSAP